MGSYKKQEYLRFIVHYWRTYKQSPAIRDIADHFATSTSVVSYYLDKLVDDGSLLPRNTGEARSIVPTEISKAIEEYFKSLDMS